MEWDVLSIKQRLNDFSCDGISDIHELPQGDMPGKMIQIKGNMIESAKLLYTEIVKELPEYLEKSKKHRVVLSVCGGSGVGKTSIAALLSYFFNSAGVGCYTLSGDHYPHRLPKYNDAERLHIFRESGIRGMIKDGVYSEETFSIVRNWQQMEDDANPVHLKELPEFSSYLKAGRNGLEAYLGTEREIAFEEVNEIISTFKSGADRIWLKHMGREETELWYKQVNMEKVSILLIEWTHGNSDYLRGVDFPIMLNSTPQETLAYRKARNRDGNTDSAFTTLVLEIEQELLRKQASKAKIILAKSGHLLTYSEYCRLMQERGEE